MKVSFKSGSLYFGQSGMHVWPVKTHWPPSFVTSRGPAFLRLQLGPSITSCSRFIRVDVGWKPCNLSLGWEPSPDVTESSENDGKLDKVVEVDSGLSGTFTPGRLPIGVMGPASMAVRMDTPSSENCLADAGNADDGRSCDDDDHNQKEGGNNDYNRDGVGDDDDDADDGDDGLDENDDDGDGDGDDDAADEDEDGRDGDRV